MVNETQGCVLALSISTRRGIPKTNVLAANLIEDWGIEGDAHAGAWHRQVSLLSIESFAVMKDKGVNVRPGGFAENITTEGLNLARLHIGDSLLIGAAELEITQIGKECHERCAIYNRAGDCVMPRAGIFAIVKRGGSVKVGDPIKVYSQLTCEPAAADGF